MRRRILAAAGALALLLPSAAAYAATPDGSDPSSRFLPAASAGKVSTSFTSAAIGADGLVTVVVEMTGDPVAVVEAEQGRELSDGERGDVKSRLKDAQEPVSAAIEDKGGSVQAEMQSAYNGLQAKVPAAELDAIASMPNVVAVHPVRTYSVDNAVSVPFLGVPQVWESTGYTGQNVKVAIIDTGIDYTHATFGGPGTVEAFQAAAATSAQPADPALYGPDAPRVKGGIDLVGDDYNADPTSASYQPVPHPDDNPLDCNGHGSHVAGTTGGSGVLADGTTYPGPYDTTTPSNTFRVGPGVAPQVDLYAVRVFGCEGSTDVVVPALDWAVDNGMDVDRDAFARLAQKADALVFTFRGNEAVLVKPTAYGWLRTEGERVVDVSIKVPISDAPMNDHAVVGTFWFRRGADFIRAADRMIAENDRINGEFYVDQVFRHMIAAGLDIRVVEVSRYVCWGTPADYEAYERTLAYWQSFVEREPWA